MKKDNLQLKQFLEASSATDIFRNILTASHDGFWIVNDDQRFEFVNDAYCDMIGYERDELLSMNSADIEVVESREEIERRNTRLLEVGHDVFTAKHRRKDGTLIDIEISMNRDSEGGITYAFLRDITGNIIEEHSLRESDIRYRSLFDNIQSGFAVHEVVFDDAGTPIDYRYISVNQAFEDLVGMKKDDIVGRTVTEVLPGIEHDPANWIAVFGDVALTGKNIQFENHSKLMDKWYSVIVYRPAPNHFATITLDITERKNNDLALRTSEEKYRELFETMEQGVVYQDADGGITAANPAAQKILGLTLDQLQGRTSIDQRWKSIYEDGTLFPGDMHPAMIALQTGKDVKNTVMGIFNPEESRNVWINVNASPQFRPHENKPYQVYTTFDDITDLKNVERELRDSESRIAIQNSITQVFLTHTDDAIYHEVLCVVLKVMRSRFGVFGYIDEQGNLVTPSMTWDIWEQCAMDEKTIIFPSDTWGDSIWGKALRSGRGSFSNTPFRVPEGHIPILRALSMPIVFRDTSIGILLIANKEEDYTSADQTLLENIASHVAPVLHAKREERKRLSEREKLEAQLRQSQKMESIGRLAGGIAHDFNNILTAIMGNAELALSTLRTHEPLYEDLTEIKSGANRAAKLTSQLLAFSRKQVIKPGNVSLNGIITGLKILIKRLVGESIEFIEIQHKDLWSVYVDSGQIEQVLINLIVNSKDALPYGGSITVETNNVVIAAKSTDAYEIVPPGEYVKLSVVDTGVGMDEETQSHIFEPFFTTKEKGKGTGLGLATCYGIIKQNNGYIIVTSRLDQGTTVDLLLPRQTGDPEQRVKPTGTTTGMPSGSESILVVEDEPTVLRMVSRVLSECGYTVIEATDGGKAMGMLEHLAPGIDLVITDVVMPGIGGKELSEKIEKLYSTVKVLFMSGYTDDSIGLHGILDDGIAFILKPFSPMEIAEEVRRVLDGR
jgi:PAS domain S-box-containing protein